MTSILEVRNLVKQYPGLCAVDHVSFAIPSGQCFGLLGPNGAGKTTSLEMIEGMVAPTSGEIYFKGAVIGASFKQESGFLFQSTALQDYLTVYETLQLFARLYGKKNDFSELIETCTLGAFLKRDTGKLSGGQRQRLLLAISLINDPELIFLDEPTTGLDPQARRNFWELLESIKTRKKTILLTTHYMEEAERLCDVVAIMDQGRILEMGDPTELLRKHFDDTLLTLPSAALDEHQVLATGALSRRDGVVNIQTKDIHATLIELNNKQIDLSRLTMHQRNLEDLFLKLTGRELRA